MHTLLEVFRVADYKFVIEILKFKTANLISIARSKCHSQIQQNLVFLSAILNFESALSLSLLSSLFVDKSLISFHYFRNVQLYLFKFSPNFYLCLIFSF